MQSESPGIVGCTIQSARAFRGPRLQHVVCLAYGLIPNEDAFRFVERRGRQFSLTLPILTLGLSSSEQPTERSRRDLVTVEMFGPKALRASASSQRALGSQDLDCTQHPDRPHEISTSVLNVMHSTRIRDMEPILRRRDENPAVS